MGTLLQIPSQVSPGQATPGLMLVGPEGELLLLHQLPSLVCGAHLTKQLLWSGYLGAKESRAGWRQLLLAADCEQGQQGEGRPVQAWQCCWLPAVCRGGRLSHGATEQLQHFLQLWGFSRQGLWQTTTKPYRLKRTLLACSVPSVSGTRLAWPPGAGFLPLQEAER